MEIKGKKGKRRGRRRTAAARAANGCGTLVLHRNVYHARWSVGGKVVSKSLRTGDLAEARAALARLSVPRTGLDERQVLRKIARILSSTLGDVAEADRVASIPVGDLFALFRDAPNRPPVAMRTLAVYEGQFRVFADWLARRHPEITNVRDVSQGVADEFVAWRVSSGKSPNTVNKDMNLFAQAWRVVSARYALEYNPWTDEHIARRKLRPNGRRNLTQEECRAVLAAATLEERAMVELALYCAFRLGDVVRLRWRDIDLAGGWVGKAQHKTGRYVAVPLAARVVRTLKEWREASRGAKPAMGARGGEEAAPDLVFPSMFARLKEDGDTENVSRIFSRLFRRAGIETNRTVGGRRVADATFHSLRHTFVTNLMQAGVDPLLVKEATGHSVMATTAGYTHIGEAVLRRAFDSAADALGTP